MKYDYIKQGDCLELMKELEDESVNIILTSPPYNNSRTTQNKRAMDNHECRYDIHLDNKTDEEYITQITDMFNEFDRILCENGTILWNMSYGNENPSIMFMLLDDLIKNTNFMIADTIVWKKKSALPNNASSNKLTRICEFVFVFCRKSEYKTYKVNKKIKSHSRTGQAYYENIFNFIEAKNNDGPNPYNKATFSTDFVEQLINMYSTSSNDVILDPFMGTGTTACGCIKLDRHYIGFELSENQCEYANKRISELGDCIWDLSDLD